jgi:hypothetical protein
MFYCVLAVDGNDGMLSCEMHGMEMLWHTGAACTVIRIDVLTGGFRKHFSDPIQQHY